MTLQDTHVHNIYCSNRAPVSDVPNHVSEGSTAIGILIGQGNNATMLTNVDIDSIIGGSAGTVTAPNSVTPTDDASSTYIFNGGQAIGIFYSSGQVIFNNVSINNIISGAGVSPANSTLPLLCAGGQAEALYPDSSPNYMEISISRTNVQVGPSCIPTPTLSIEVLSCGINYGVVMNRTLYLSAPIQNVDAQDCITIEYAENVYIYGQDNLIFCEGGCTNSQKALNIVSGGQNITIENFFAVGFGIQIASTSGAVAINYCYISNTSTALVLIGDGDQVFSVRDSQFSGGTNGIHVLSANNVIVERCLFRNLTGCAVNLAVSGGARMLNNTIEQANCGITVVSPKTSITGNNLTNVGTPITATFSSSGPAQRIINSNTITNQVAQYGMRVECGYDSQEVVIQDNTIKDISYACEVEFVAIEVSYCSLSIVGNTLSNIRPINAACPAVFTVLGYSITSAIGVVNFINNNIMHFFGATNTNTKLVGMLAVESTLDLENCIFSGFYGYNPPSCESCEITTPNIVVGIDTENATLTISNSEFSQFYGQGGVNVTGSSTENAQGGSVYGIFSNPFSNITISDSQFTNLTGGVGGFVSDLPQCAPGCSFIAPGSVISTGVSISPQPPVCASGAPNATTVTKPLTSGSAATISGANFTGYLSVFIGKTVCPILESNITSITFLAPPGSGFGYKVLVYVGCQVSTVTPLLYYQAPEIFRATPVPNTGGHMLITGNNFGNNSNQINVTIGSVPCSNITIIFPHTEIQCYVGPQISTVPQNIVITVAGQNNSESVAVKYYVPVCSVNNGGCDPRVSCTSQGSNVVCGPCPTGTYGDSHAGCIVLCGDGICDASIGENCVSCYKDCPFSDCGICGDSSCNATHGESCGTCFKDCGACGVQTCQSGCSGHGTCNEGACACNPPWTGPSCSTDTTQPITVVINNSTTPNITLTSPPLGESSFAIALQEIYEENPQSEILQSYSLADINFTSNTTIIGKNTQTNFSALLDNGAIVEVVVTQFQENATAIEFANQTNIYTPNTLKLAFAFYNWPFKALANTLNVVINSAASGNTAKKKTCVTENTNAGGGLVNFMVVIDHVSLYGQFISKAVLDGHVRNISYILNSDTTITASLPHFWDSADMDPQFSVLLADSQATCAGKHHGVNLKIILPIIFGVLFLAVVFIIIFPRIRLWRKLHGAKRVKSTESVGSEMNSREIEKIGTMEVNSNSGRYVMQL